MKVLLVHPQINSIKAYSYGIGYLISVLTQAGHSAYCLPLRDLKDVFILTQKVKQEQPGMVAFSLLTAEAGYLGDIIRSIKEVSDPFVVAGGIHPTLEPECISEISGLDAVIRGEGEYPLVELADRLENNQDFLDIQNGWFKRDGQIIKNDLRPLIDLDRLPRPDKDDTYQDMIDLHWGINRFIFSRGCPFDCSYCSNAALRQMSEGLGRYCRSMSPEKAIELIEADDKRFKFKSIYFDDDIMSLDRDWFDDFMGLYRKRLTYPFGCNIRAGTIDADMVKTLKAAGCQHVAVGIEHGNEKFRTTVLNRKMSNALLADTFRLLRDAGIKTISGHIMVGLPFETMELFLDTVRLLRRLQARPIKFVYSPLPGTRLGRLCRDHGWMPPEAYYNDRLQAVIDYPHFNAEEIQLCFNVLDALVRYPVLPLRLPGIPTKHLLNIYRLVSWLFPEQREIMKPSQV